MNRIYSAAVIAGALLAAASAKAQGLPVGDTIVETETTGILAEDTAILGEETTNLAKDATTAAKTTEMDAIISTPVGTITNDFSAWSQGVVADATPASPVVAEQTLGAAGVAASGGAVETSNENKAALLADETVAGSGGNDPEAALRNDTLDGALNAEGLQLDQQDAAKLRLAEVTEATDRLALSPNLESLVANSAAINAQAVRGEIWQSQVTSILASWLAQQQVKLSDRETIESDGHKATALLIAAGG